MNALSVTVLVFVGVIAGFVIGWLCSEIWHKEDSENKYY